MYKDNLQPRTGSARASNRSGASRSYAIGRGRACGACRTPPVSPGSKRANRREPGDPWFARLRDAYLEPWGQGFADTFELAIRVGAFAHPIAWARQRDALPDEARRAFDKSFAVVLRRALAYAL